MGCGLLSCLIVFPSLAVDAPCDFAWVSVGMVSPMPVHWSLGFCTNLKAFVVSFLEPLFVLECGFFLCHLLGLPALMLQSLLNELSCMWVPVLVPAMTGIQKLRPHRWSSPVLMYVPDHLHEAMDWTFLHGGRLLDCKMKPGLELIPESWFSFLPVVACCLSHEWLVNRLQI